MGPGLDRAKSTGLASGREEEQPVDDHGGGIVEVGAGRGVQLVELPRARQPHLYDLRANTSKEVESDRPSGVPGGVGLGCDLHADVLKSSLAEQLRNATADPWVRSVAAED